jgi:hypothetical protein
MRLTDRDVYEMATRLSTQYGIHLTRSGSFNNLGELQQRRVRHKVYSLISNTDIL